MPYTPSINQSGIFKLKPPFDSLVTPQVVYTCRSLRTINDVLASGEQPYEKFYKPLSISETDFNKDAKTNACIVGLQAGTGEWIYVPDSFILSAPSMNGVKYSPIVLGVSLGAIPDNFNLEGLISAFKDITMSTIGVEPQIKGMLVAQPAMIDRDKHERLEIARKEKIKQNKTDFVRVKELTDETAVLRLKIVELEKWILNNVRR